MSNLDRAFKAQKKTTQQIKKELYGSLGIPINGRKTIEVPNRQAFVYVRLRDNQNEVVQAFNNKVAASYDLPVVLVREGNRYIVQGVNTQRYENNWNNSAPYLPKHGTSHSFPYGGGGDVTWIFDRQIMPALIYPNTETGTNVKMYGYPFLANDNRWRLVGNTGTQELISYRPITGAMSLMVLVYLDANTGNPGLLVNSGSQFPQNITGNNVFQYLPSPTSNNQIPLAGVLLSTGTSSISWANIYGVRQWVQSIPTGTAAGGGSGTSINIQDEGVPKGTASTFNFVGDNVDVSISGTVARVFVTGTAGSSLDHFWTSGSAGVNSLRVRFGGTADAVKDYAIAMGFNTYASGTYALAEGLASKALNDKAHAEGDQTIARGVSSHSEGSLTQALGSYSHAEGASTTAYGQASFAGGIENSASGTASFTMGQANTVHGNYSAILGGRNSLLNVDDSVILGGIGLSGTLPSSAYVPKLNIKSMSTGTSMFPLGIDSLGFVVTGTAPNGTYNPTLVSGTNTQTIVATNWMYYRTGDFVTVAGRLQVDTGAIGAFTCFASLPIPSNFTSTDDVSGNGTQPGAGVPNIISVREDQTNDRFQIDGYAQVSTNLTYRLVIVYIVK